jgi:hypothetical protein
MATTKTATLTFRIDPGLKEALRAAAHQEHRSIANMVEVLIRDYCQINGIDVPPPRTQTTTMGRNQHDQDG